MDNKKTYYVAVGSGDIGQEQDAFAYEFEINATDEEIERLSNLVEDKENADDLTYVRAHIPFEGYHDDTSNDKYDRSLIEIYHMLHELGTPETKTHIDSMHVLDEFPNMPGDEHTPLGPSSAHV